MKYDEIWVPRNTDSLLLNLIAPSDLLDPSFLHVSELFSGFLKCFPGTHRQFFKKLQEILEYTDHRVEKRQSTLDLNNPRDSLIAVFYTWRW